MGTSTGAVYTHAQVLGELGDERKRASVHEQTPAVHMKNAGHPTLTGDRIPARKKPLDAIERGSGDIPTMTHPDMVVRVQGNDHLAVQRDVNSVVVTERDRVVTQGDLLAVAQRSVDFCERGRHVVSVGGHLGPFLGCD